MTPPGIAWNSFRIQRPVSSRGPPSFHQTVAGLTSARTCRTSEGWHTRGRLKGDRRRAGVCSVRGSGRRMRRGRAIGRNTAAGVDSSSESPWGNTRPRGSDGRRVWRGIPGSCRDLYRVGRGWLSRSGMHGRVTTANGCLTELSPTDATSGLLEIRGSCGRHTSVETKWTRSLWGMSRAMR